MFQPVDIADELRKKRSSEQNLLDEAYLIVKEAETKGTRFSPPQKPLPDIFPDLNLLDRDDQKKIFSSREMKRFCVLFHMRFLPLKAAGLRLELEKEIILSIYVFEEKYNVRIQDFFVMLTEEIDGMPGKNPGMVVFGKVATNSYIYFGCSGQKITTLRKIKFFPLQSIYCFALFNWLPAMVVAYLLPYSWLLTTSQAEWTLRLWLTCHTYIAFFGFFVFLGALGNVHFSENVWTSPFKKNYTGS
jgi:hypothetical protein